MAVANPKNGLSYDDLFSRLADKEFREWVSVGRNTYVEWIREDENENGDIGFIAMTFHKTKVVNFLDNDTVQLFDGGYKTKSTKNRLDWALLPIGFRLSQVNGTWKVYSIRTGAYRDYTAGMIVERGAF